MMESQDLIATADAMIRTTFTGAAIAIIGGAIWLTVFRFVIPWVARR